MSVHLHHDAWGRLVLVDDQGRQHIDVEPVRAFPISQPDQWIALVSGDGEELALVDDLAGLSPASQQALEEELRRRSFMPQVQRIVSIEADASPARWMIETDRGRTEFLVESGDDVRLLSPRGLLIVDNHGIRYLITDVLQLDAASRELVEQYL